MSNSITMANLEKALAGESMAHIKYRYFARLAWDEGLEDIAMHFEKVASQEFKHAISHLELLIGKPSTKECLQKAIAGETYEYTEMYPQFEEIARREGDLNSAQEAFEQMQESKQHAEEFAAILEKAEKRFNALKKVEERHANEYKKILEAL